MIATTTCMYLNNQLQNNESKENPPFKYDSPKNNNMASASDAWIVFDNDPNKLLMILIIYTLI